LKKKRKKKTHVLTPGFVKLQKKLPGKKNERSFLSRGGEKKGSVHHEVEEKGKKGRTQKEKKRYLTDKTLALQNWVCGKKGYNERWDCMETRS